MLADRCSEDRARFQQLPGTYNAAQQVIEGAGLGVILPISEPFLEHAEPSTFYSEVAGRIRQSRAAIILFIPETPRARSKPLWPA